MEAIYKEAKALQKLSYPSIVQLYHAFIWKNDVVLIMEYVSGGELYSYVKSRGSVSELEARKIFRQLVYTVDYCHNKYVIHRDLKPSNILISSQHTLDVKLIDFGISGSNYGKDKSTAGSLAYMPPEVLASDNTAAEPAIDVWALGVILYFMVYGYLPFRGRSEREVVKAILGSKVTFPDAKKHVTSECKELMRSLLLRDPKKRIKVTEVLQSAWLALPDETLQEFAKAAAPKLGAEENKVPSRKKFLSSNAKASVGHKKMGGESLILPSPPKLHKTPVKIGKKSPLPSKILDNKMVIKNKAKE